MLMVCAFCSFFSTAINRWADFDELYLKRHVSATVVFFGVRTTISQL